MPLLAVTANDIDTAGYPIDAGLPVEWLDHELADALVHAVAPGHIAARLSRSGKCVVVRGRVKAEVEAPCVRCLGPTRTAVDADLSLLLVPTASAKAAHGHGHAHGAHGTRTPSGGKGDEAVGAAKDRRTTAKDEEYEFSAEEAEHDTFDGETVILDEFVREVLLLELPNFPLCSEACAGIRPRAAVQSGSTSAETKKPLDPRLQPLSALRAKLFEAAGDGEESAPRRAASAAKPVTTRRSRPTPLKANLMKTKKKSTKKE